jgi:hypothetical protein
METRNAKKKEKITGLFIFGLHYQKIKDFKSITCGCAIAQAVSRRLTNAVARVRARSDYLGFVVNKVALGRFFSEYFDLTPLPIFIPPISPQSQSPIIRGWYNRPVSGRSTKSPIAQIKKKNIDSGSKCSLQIYISFSSN